MRSIGFVGLLAVSMNALAQDAHDHQQHGGHESNAASVASAEHVAPDAPSHVMPDMSYRDMVREMQMDDRMRFGRVVIDELEWVKTDDRHSIALDARASYGGDYDKLLAKIGGEHADGRTEELSGEVLWDRIFARWWSVQAGAMVERLDEPDSRVWAAVGIEGLAPYWFDIEAMVYFGEQGRTALRAKASYEFLLTQRLIVNSELESIVYSKSDPELNRPSGLGKLNAGLRVRYEFRREFAPYVGAVWQRSRVDSAGSVHANDETSGEVALVAGVRIWF